MTRYVEGDIFDSGADALVNPVNIVGVMGAGLAKQFRSRYPVMHSEYLEACRSGRLGLGQVLPHVVQKTPPCYVVSFPTKAHWRDRSRLEWIDSGLVALQALIVSLPIRSIAVPPLGCGLGGLRWEDVRKLVDSRLGELDGVDVIVYPPVVRRPT